MCGQPDVWTLLLQQTSTGLFWQDRPSLPHLLQFPLQHGHINILREIGIHYKDFSIHLLNDGTGAITAAITKQCLAEAYEINHEVFKRWLQGQGKHPVTWKTLVDVLYSLSLFKLVRDIGSSLQTTQQVCMWILLIVTVCPTSLPFLPLTHTYLYLQHNSLLVYDIIQ